MTDASTNRLAHASPLIALWVLGLLLNVGCTSQRPEPSGFLPNYDVLTPIAGRENALGYYEPGLQPGAYERLLVEEVQVLYDSDASGQSVEQKAPADLTDSLYIALVLALQERFALVTQPGPGVLRVRTALTHVSPDRALLGVMPAAGYVLPFDFGTACLEAHLIDSVSEAPVVSLLDYGFGRKIDWARATANWQQPRMIFRSWAAHLEAILLPTEPNDVGASED